MLHPLPPVVVPVSDKLSAVETYTVSKTDGDQILQKILGIVASLLYLTFCLQSLILQAEVN